MDVSDKPAERLPEPLRRQLPADGQRLILAVGDITLAGQYGHSILTADDRFVYYGPDAKPAEDDGQLQLARVDLDSIRRVRIDGYFGNCCLVLERDDDSIRAARFTNTRVADFESAGRRLTELLAERAGRKLDPADAASQIRIAGRRPPTCPKCGRVLSPRAEVCIYCADKRQLLRRLISLLRPHRKIAVVCFILTMCVAGLGLVPPVLSKAFVDKAIIPRDAAIFVLLLAAYAGAMLASNTVSIFRTRVVGWLGQRIIYDLRKATFARLQELSLRYYESKQTGKLMNRITTDTERIERFVVEGLQEVIVDIATLTAILCILFYFNWQLALIVIIPTPAVAALIYFFARRVKTTYRRAWRMAASITAHLADVIPGVRVVKGFAREKDEAERFDRRSSRLFAHNYDVARQRSTVFPVINMMTQLAYILLWTVGGLWAIRQFSDQPELLSDPRGQGTMLGTLFLFSQMIWRFYDPINRLSNMSDQVQRATTSAERVFELLDAFPDVSQPARPRTLAGGAGSRARGHIEFRNVSFCYEANVPVLREVSLDIKPGEMVGIVGHSGVGKSTLASLLLRFYDPDGGQVLLDGVDIRELSTAELRGNIGLVLQEPTLFHGSVRANISYGRHGASAEEVIAAAKVANAHQFLLRLPEGYDTEIGERGVRLSQGEKQRISIARAILPDPPILILDEATASVDTETERLIQSALDRLIHGRTVLAIAHRLSTLRNADRIIVLSEGRIAEMGTHNELIDREGLYYQLCQAQSMMGQAVTPSPVVDRPRLDLVEPPVEGEAEEVGRDGI